MLNIEETMNDQGMKMLMLENAQLRLTFLPEYGANLWSIFDKSRNCELLWHHPILLPRKVKADEVYDDIFFGGWHELFPNDVPERSDGRELMDHGELWFSEWDLSIEQATPEQGSILFSTNCLITPAHIQKRCILHNDQPYFDMEYLIENKGPSSFDFMFKIHAAVDISAGDQIELPVKRCVMENTGLPSRIPPGETFLWRQYGPDGIEPDMAVVPAKSVQLAELIYGLDLEAGRCGLRRPGKGVRISWHFDPKALPTVWTFASYGAWRGLYTLIFEPCSGYPLLLSEAREKGIVNTLEPGASFHTTVRFQVDSL